jgi:indolepyruvate decarboxylase
MAHSEITVERPAAKMHSPPPTVTGLSIGDYLIQRLQDYGIGHVFGIPGDYILQFYSMLDRSPIEVVTTTREDCAGFAADAYARIHGMGPSASPTVWGAHVCNSIAGAYREIAGGVDGSPGRAAQQPCSITGPDFHAVEVFEKLCVAGRADRPKRRFKRSTACSRRARHKRRSHQFARYGGRGARDAPPLSATHLVSDPDS